MFSRTRRPAALIILDGWPVPDGSSSNLLARAHTPFYSELCEQFPRSELAAAGPYVGLMDDEEGGPEAGHRTIGAGRVLMADSVRIRNAVASDEFSRNDVLRGALAKAVRSGKCVHFIGLLSDAGTESHQDSLFALLRMARSVGVERPFVHCILDGLDVRPRTADVYVEALQVKMAEIGVGRVASLCGRFFAMDSRQNWERTARAFTMLVHGEGERARDPISAIRASYLRGISDEFITPVVIENEQAEPVATVRDGDLVIFFNHGAEAMRQLARSLSVSDAGGLKGKIDAVCLTEYDADLSLPVAFGPGHARNTLAEMFDLCGVRNYRITESTRAEHVTEFFNGRGHARGELEKRLVLQAEEHQPLETGPESKSFKIADRAVTSLEGDPEAALIVNLPAADIASAGADDGRVIEAMQYVDTCLGGILERLRHLGGAAIITSSHPATHTAGVSENKAHNFRNSRVPVHYFDPSNSASHQLRADGSLEDVAPTLLRMIGIDKPSDMTGRDLLSN